MVLCLQEVFGDKISFNRPRNRNRRVRHLGIENDAENNQDLK